MVDFDVMDLLADSADCNNADEGEDGTSLELPSCLPPLPLDVAVQAFGDRCILVQAVALGDVGALRDQRFNSNNHHEWAPFRSCGGNAVLVDPAWWRSLGQPIRVELEKAVEVTVAPREVIVPHETEIGHCAGCNAMYHAYLDAFSFARWASMKPDGVMVPLPLSDRAAMERFARQQVLGGSCIQDKDFEILSRSLLQQLEEAIDHVGGKAFAKTAEKSAKNDVALKGHTTASSILRELTASQDVLRQSLGRGATGRRQTARYLVVQPWVDSINKRNEFRVIIINRQVAAITQQTWACFVGHTIDTATSCVPPILELWNQELLPRSPYADCVLDVYVVDARAHLIEINPCGFWGSSGGGLFHWIHDRDLLLDPKTLVVRFVTEARHASTLGVGDVSGDT
eukprot:TRINITY_DN38465_c0_g2_i1.p1 TRINITY_DN38465_c0_g2~~TRINITY_DN38465_c0_g2_i1.p1  ORF type:complete len:399 (+),score=39.26 TRINITY_DN38465_c0_g2_i1:130-1326(+)